MAAMFVQYVYLLVRCCGMNSDLRSRERHCCQRSSWNALEMSSWMLHFGALMTSQMPTTTQKVPAEGNSISLAYSALIGCPSGMIFDRNFTPYVTDFIFVRNFSFARFHICQKNLLRFLRFPTLMWKSREAFSRKRFSFTFQRAFASLPLNYFCRAPVDVWCSAT